MPKKGLSEVVVILDKSGSMDSIKNDAIGGFNSFLDSQQKLDGEANFSLVLFSDKYDMCHKRTSIKDAPKLTDKTYQPEGRTALFDAIGKTINLTGVILNNTPEEDRPEKVIFAILTDGEENFSKEFHQLQINEMIKHQTEKYQWEFIFLAANQDAMKSGETLGIQPLNTFSFTATGQGVRSAYRGLHDTVTKYRTK
jgi:hypothetical protein